MRLIVASNVDEALCEGLNLLRADGVREETRNGPALVMPCPVMTVNKQPMNRVLFSAKRDANPFFHLMEALWMLAGRNDATWLDQFVGDFSKRFAEDDGLQHGAYGFRWRRHFEPEGGGTEDAPDQLETAIRLLKTSPSSRQVVISMWDPIADLAAIKRDIPCNTHIYCRVRHIDPRSLGIDVNNMDPDGSDYHLLDAIETNPVLDLTVCCRSNDAVWGCHGANVVHFSILQEYLAARIGVKVGTLYQLSNNYHVYMGVLEKMYPLDTTLGWYIGDTVAVGGKPTPIVTHPDDFDRDLVRFFGDKWEMDGYQNRFFGQVAVPLRMAYEKWRTGNRSQARAIVFNMNPTDWQAAASDWFHRKINKQF